MEPKICVWCDLTSEHLDVLFSATTNENLLKILGDICKIDNLDEPKSQILLEYYFHTIQFAKSQGMNYAQTSSLFTIMKLIHQMCVATSYNNNKETFLFFKQLLVKHSLQRPPYSVGIFSVQHVQAITDYALNTYFRHFNMYKYAFTPKVRVDISFHYDGVPPTPEPIIEPEVAPVDVEQEPEVEEVEEEVTSPVEETEEIKQMRELVQVAMGSELKQLQTKLEKLIGDQDAKLSKQVEALEESLGMKSGAKSPGSKSKKK